MKIYLITNKINGKVYVGQTRQKEKRRFQYHKSMLRADAHDNDYLQKAWNKYGEENFDFSVLESGIRNINKLNEKEEFYIKKYKAIDRKHGYNLREAGNSYIFTDEAKKRISEAQRKRFSKDSERQKLSDKAKELYKNPKRIKWASERSKETWKNHRNKMLSNLEKAREKAIKSKAKWYDGFVSPEGKIYDNIFNLRAFCREHNLTYSSMQRVNYKTMNQHKGWTRYEPE